MPSLKFSRALTQPERGGQPFNDLCQPAWQKMHVKAAWKFIADAKPKAIGPAITVAIPDWGIQKHHEGFNGRVAISGIRVIPPFESNDFSDDDGHGTMLAGTIAAIANGLGAGKDYVAPVKLLALKFIDVLTPPMSSYAAKAIRCAVNRGARVINASWDVGCYSRELEDAIRYAGDKVVVVVAAGNNGSNNDLLPAFPATFGLSNMISVMAADTDKEEKPLASDGGCAGPLYNAKPGFSNYGKERVDIAAAGVNIMSTSPYLVQPSRAYSSAYRLFSGTSAAAAHIAGAAALLLSLKPDWNAQDVRNCLMESVDPVPGLDRCCQCGGRLNLLKAVKIALRR